MGFVQVVNKEVILWNYVTLYTFSAYVVGIVCEDWLYIFGVITKRLPSQQETWPI